MAVRISLLLTAVAVAVAYPFHGVIAHGILLGGIGGVLAFWIVALRLEKLATVAPGKVNLAPLRWSLVRLAIYVLVLYRAYLLDQKSLLGLLGAAGGLFIIRLVLVFLGLTGFDLKQEKK